MFGLGNKSHEGNRVCEVRPAHHNLLSNQSGLVLPAVLVIFCMVIPMTFHLLGVSLTFSRDMVSRELLRRSMEDLRIEVIWALRTDQACTYNYTAGANGQVRLPPLRNGKINHHTFTYVNSDGTAGGELLKSNEVAGRLNIMGVSYRNFQAVGGTPNTYVVDMTIHAKLASREELAGRSAAIPIYFKTGPGQVVERCRYSFYIEPEITIEDQACRAQMGSDYRFDFRDRSCQQLPFVVTGM